MSFQWNEITAALNTGSVYGCRNAGRNSGDRASPGRRMCSPSKMCGKTTLEITRVNYSLGVLWWGGPLICPSQVRGSSTPGLSGPAPGGLEFSRWSSGSRPARCAGSKLCRDEVLREQDWTPLFSEMLINVTPVLWFGSDLKWCMCGMNECVRWVLCVGVTVLMAAWEISPRSDPALLRPVCNGCHDLHSQEVVVRSRKRRYECRLGCSSKVHWSVHFISSQDTHVLPTVLGL